MIIARGVLCGAKVKSSKLKKLVGREKKNVRNKKESELQGLLGVRQAQA